jgi:hypothetical protein
MPPHLGLCERHILLVIIPLAQVKVIDMDIALLHVVLVVLFFQLAIISRPVPLPRVRDRIPERALLVVLMFRTDCTQRLSSRVRGSG